MSLIHFIPFILLMMSLFTGALWISELLLTFDSSPWKTTPPIRLPEVRIASEGWGMWLEGFWEPFFALVFPDRHVVIMRPRSTIPTDPDWNVTILNDMYLMPDLIVRGFFIDREPELKFLTTPYITYHPEPWQKAVSLRGRYLPMMEAHCQKFPKFATPNVPKIWFPYVAASFREFGHYDLEETRRKHITYDRPFVMAYQHRNCQVFRDAMFRMICQQSRVSTLPGCHGLSRCMHTPGLPQDTLDAGFGGNLTRYAQYTFVLCIESKNIEGYISEKIATVFASGAIPIYAGGGETARRIFNPKAFIDIDAIAKNRGDVGEVIYSIATNKTAIREMLNQPVFRRDSDHGGFFYEPGTKKVSKFYQDLAKTVRGIIGAEVLERANDRILKTQVY